MFVLDTYVHPTCVHVCNRTAMRQCNDCQDWFHDECVGSDTDADTEEGFRCDDCKASNKRCVNN